MAGVFPLASKQDSSYYSVTPEDSGMRSELEGGYVASRSRHTRVPRNTYTTGFTNLSNDDKNTLLAFWQANKGSSDSFSWTDPIEGSVVVVRFTKGFTFKYTGIRSTHRWTVSDIELEEV